MNRFIVDYHPDAIAKALCDQHRAMPEWLQAVA